MNPSGMRKIAAWAACMIPAAVAPCYAAAPAQIQITAADLAAGQFPTIPAFTDRMGVLFRQGAARPASAAIPTIPAVTFGYYPADVSNPRHNPTLQSVTFHDIFINPLNPASGVFLQGPDGPAIEDVDAFLNNLDNSDFIHLTDQYTGNPNPSRSVGQPGVVNYEVTRSTLYDADVAILVHAAARTFGAGYGAMYHILFSQGTDVCTANGPTGVACYSPDNPSTFFFCGYHGYFNFPDLGHVIFSVEPYANVRGCSAPAGTTPNTPAVDSMANVLSHETFEAISDPDLNAWGNRLGILNGAEIGDECVFVFAIPPVSLNGKPYQIQSEYSNFYHACSWTSSGAPAP